mgnify:CR=1 FL=1
MVGFGRLQINIFRRVFDCRFRASEIFRNAFVIEIRRKIVDNADDFVAFCKSGFDFALKNGNVADFLLERDK